ncbi:MAG: hypothetical protein JWN39_4206 [Ilumatobacteraceae bacterium]|nr:hypothetical protein [Ilumatobacteraceae bacterium]
MNSTSLPVGRVLRIVAAIAILVSGIVHLDIYFNQGYRLTGLAPNANFGRSILLNAIGAGIVAIALIARKEWFVRAAGIGYAASTVAIFLYTHSGGHSFLSFRHGGPVFDPSPQAQLTVIMGIIAIVALAATFVPAIDAADTAPMNLPAVGAAFAITAIALIGLTLKWRPDNSTTTPAAAPTTTVATAASTAGTTADSTAGSTADSTASSAAPAAGGTAVSIKNFAFDGNDVTVAKGTTVTWTNNDTATHTVVAADADVSFVSDNLPTGATFQHVFDKAGTFPYICGIHPRMKGTITVTG